MNEYIVKSGCPNEKQAVSELARLEQKASDHDASNIPITVIVPKGLRDQRWWDRRGLQSGLPSRPAQCLLSLLLQFQASKVLTSPLKGGHRGG